MLALFAGFVLVALDRGGNGPWIVAAQTDDTPTVEVISVARRDVTLRIELAGSVEPIARAKLFSRAHGYLASISVDIGDCVEEGQVLATISAPEMEQDHEVKKAEIVEAEARVAQARAAVAEADAGIRVAESALAQAEAGRKEKVAVVALREVELQRTAELLDENPAFERRKLDEARYRLEAARAEHEGLAADLLAARSRIDAARAHANRARADLAAVEANVTVARAALTRLETLGGFLQIHAPFAGFVTAREVDAGAYVHSADQNSAARSILEIERIDRVRVVVDLPMGSSALANRGDPVVFDRLQALPGARFEGTITRVSESLGGKSRTMRAEIELENRAAAGSPPGAVGPLRTGYFGYVAVILDRLTNIPVVPLSAIRSDADGSHVLIVASGVVERRGIELGANEGDDVAILEGLDGGERVIAGRAAVRAGDRVTAVVRGEGRSP